MPRLHSLTSVRHDHKDLLKNIEDDMQLLIRSANTHNILLKGYPSLLDDNYKTDMETAMKELHKVSSETARQLEFVDMALQEPDIDFQVRFDDFFTPDTQPQSRRPSGRSRRARNSNNSNNGNTNINNNEFDALRELRNALNPVRTTTNGREEPSTAESTQRSNVDLEVVNSEMCRIDPLSRGPIKERVRNRRCHHIYCYTTIVPYIRSMTYPRCPIAGCKLPHIVEADLERVEENDE